MILFILIDFAQIGVRGHYPPFYAVESILIPFDEKLNLIPANYVLNIGINLIFIIVLIKTIDNLFEINSYILTRAKRKKVFTAHVKCIFEKILILLAIKIVADLCCAQIKGLQNFNLFIWLTLSTLITISIYATIIYMFKLLHIKTQYIYFFIIFLISITNIFVEKISAFTIFTIASPVFVINPLVWMVLKLLLLIILSVINCNLLKKFEHIGDLKND